MTAHLGPIHYLGFVVVGGAIFVLWRLRRHAPLVPLELGALILVILVAGPLSWDHYFVWAVIPVVLMADVRYWSAGSKGRNTAVALTAAVAILLFAQYVRVPTSAAVRADWSLRLTTTPYALGAVLLLGCAVMLLREPKPAPTDVPVSPVPDQPSVEAVERVRTSVR